MASTVVSDGVPLADYKVKSDRPTISSSLAILNRKPVSIKISSDPSDAFCFVYPKGLELALTFEDKPGDRSEKIPLSGKTPFTKISSTLPLMQLAGGNNGLNVFIFRPGYESAVVTAENSTADVDFGRVKLVSLDPDKAKPITVKELLSQSTTYIGRLVQMKGRLAKISPDSERHRAIMRQVGASRQSIEQVPKDVVLFSFSEPPYEDALDTSANNGTGSTPYPDGAPAFSGFALSLIMLLPSGHALKSLFGSGQRH